METTLIIMRHHWKAKDTWSHWLPWNVLHSLCCVSTRLAIEEKVSIFMPRFQYPDSSTHLSQTKPHQNCQKVVPFLLGAPCVPQEWIYYSKFFLTKNLLHPPKSVPYSGRSFDPQMILSVYQMEEKWSILLQNKRRHFSERESEGEGNKPFLASVCAKKLF